MARGVLFGGLLLAAAAGGAWWMFLRDSRTPAPVDDVGEAEASAVESPDAAGMLASQGGQPRAPATATPAISGRILGRVVDAKEKAVAGVRVLLRREGDGGRSEPVEASELARISADRARKRFADFDAPPVSDAPFDAEFVSDADGKFVATVDRVGNYVLDAKPDAPAVGERVSTRIASESLEAKVVLHLVVGTPLRGRVIDAADRPVAAVVSGSWWKVGRSVALAAVATDPATGEFGWAGVPDGQVSLSVKVAGRAERSVRVTTPKSDVLVIRIAGGGSLVGRVLDGLGAPVSDADVLVGVTRAEAKGDKGDGIIGGSGRTKSGADGAYRIDGLPVGKLSSVTLSAAGQRGRSEYSSQGGQGAAKWAGTEVKEGGETTLDLLFSRGGTVTGRVLEAGTGKPVVDAQVLLLPSADRYASEVVKSAVDANGRFRFEGAPLGRYIVFATASRHYLAGVGRDTTGEAYEPNGPLPADAPVAVLTKEGDTVEKDLEMKPGLAVHGKVTGPDGAPIADADIRSNNVGGLSQSTWRWRVRYSGSNDPLTKSGADGTFRLTNLPPGNAISFYAQKKPLSGEPSASVRLAAGEPEPDVALTMVAGATIVGRVLDADGAPLSARQVQWQLNDNRRQGYGVTTTGDDGVFRFEGVTPGAVYLYTWSSGGSLNTQLTLDPPLKSGEVREGVELKAGRSATVRGTVVDEAGAPVARDLVVTHSGSMSQARSGADGQFEVSVPEGTITIGAKKDDSWDIEGQGVTVKAPAEGVRIVVTERPTTIVAGKVVDPDGAPVPLCTLRAGPQPRDRWNMETTDEVTGGEFRREVRQAPPFDVTVSAPRGSRGESLNLRGKRVRVESAKTDLVITLDSGKEIRGRVVDASSAGNGGVDGVVIRAGETSALTDSTGAFRLGGLAEGEITISIRAPRGYAPVPTKRVTAGAEDVVVTLTKGGSVAGKVVGLDQVPGAQGWVTTDGAGIGSQIAGDGSFRIDGLPESGTVDVRVQLWSQTGGMRSARRKGVPVGTMNLEIAVDRGVALRGTIVDADGKPGAHMYVQTSGDDATTAQADAEGKWSFQGLTPGPVTLSVMNSNGQVQLAGVKVDAPSEDVRLVLPARRRLTGRLLGSGIRGFNVQARTPTAGPDTQALGSANVDAEGRFSMEVSGDGPFQLRAVSAEDDRFGRLDGARPGVDANVTLEQGLSIEGVVEGSDGVATSSGGWVWARAEQWSTYAMIAKEGTFRFRGLPPGRYTLTAQNESGGSSPKEDVDAGATGVRIRISR